MPKKKLEKTRDGQSTLLLQLLKGGVVAALVAVVMLVGVALLVSSGILSRALASMSVMGICAFGAVVGGLYALVRCERGFLLVGIGAGAVEWLLLLVSAICVGGLSGVGGTLGSVVACLGGGLLAGTLYALRGGGHKRKSDYRW